MKKVEIISQHSEKPYVGRFETESELNEWVEFHKNNNTWGRAAYDEQVEVSPAVTEEREIKDENGNSFDPPQYETVEIPAQYNTIHHDAEYEIGPIEDTTEQDNLEKAISEKVALGEQAQRDSERTYNLIAGFNIDRQLTPEQITTMQTTFSPVIAALNAKRPGQAKAMIAAIDPDGTVVTAEMKDMALHILRNW